MSAVGGAAFAQGPAPTEWTPRAPTVDVKPLPQLTPLTPPPLTLVPTPGTTMSLQKAPGENQPVQARPVSRPFGAMQATPAVQQKDKDAPPKDVTPPGEKSKAVEQKGNEKPAAALPNTPGGVPLKEDVFRFDSDAALDKRILKDLNNTMDTFPPVERLVPAGTTYVAKTGSYPRSQVTLEPNYVVHRRLYFEELNSDRYGWDAGPIQPIYSTLYFYKDTLFWPHNLVSGLWHDRFDTNAGKCLPGNPVPYYFYPPGFTVSGSLAEAAIVTGVAVILP